MRPIRAFLLLVATGAAFTLCARTRAEDPKLPGLVASLPPAKDESHLFSIAYSKDGKTLVTVLEKNVHCYDTKTWQERSKVTLKDPERPLALAPDGKSFAWLEGPHGKPDVSTYDADNDEPTASFQMMPHVGSLSPRLALVADGKTIIACGRLDRCATLWRWDVASTKLALTQLEDTDDCFYALAVSEDGKIAAGGLQGPTNVVCVFEVETGKVLRRLKTGDHIAKSVALSPDGKRLAVSGQEEPVRIYDLSSGKLLAKLDHTYAACVRFSSDSKLLASSDREQLCLWDVTTKKLLGVFGRKGALAEGPRLRRERERPGGRSLFLARRQAGRVGLRDGGVGHGARLRRGGVEEGGLEVTDARS